MATVYVVIVLVVFGLATIGGISWALFREVKAIKEANDSIAESERYLEEHQVDEQNE